MVRNLGGLIAAVLCLAALDATAQVKETIDRFTGAKELTYSSVAPVKIGVPRLIASFGTRDGETNGRLTLIMSSLTDRRTGSTWKYLRCHQMAWLLDDAPLDLGKAHHEGRVVPGGVIEIISQAVTPVQMQAIGNASRAEYRICTDVYSLSGSDIAALREMAGRQMGAASPHSEGGQPAPGQLPGPSPAPITDCVSCGNIGKGF